MARVRSHAVSHIIALHLVLGQQDKMIRPK